MDNVVGMFDGVGSWDVADFLLDVNVNSWVLNHDWYFNIEDV